MSTDARSNPKPLWSAYPLGVAMVLRDEPEVAKRAFELALGMNPHLMASRAEISRLVQTERDAADTLSHIDGVAPQFLGSPRRFFFLCGFFARFGAFCRGRALSRPLRSARGPATPSQRTTPTDRCDVRAAPCLARWHRRRRRPKCIQVRSRGRPAPHPQLARGEPIPLICPTPPKLLPREDSQRAVFAVESM